MREMAIDLFAGGGGASLGIEQALGVPVDLAVNHNPVALAMHAANHPGTVHGCEDVWSVDPRRATNGRPVGLLWASPDCTHFSRAKGGKPVEKNIRTLAWVVVRWAAAVRPRVILLENVPEFREWGPLDGDNQPDRSKAGATYHLWCNRLRGLGYRVESRALRACDYGAPTIRKRLFVVARCDGQPIVWPEPTHGEPGNLFGLPAYRTAAECIDWSIPCPSIFERKRPLAEKTLRRIARGITKYVIEAREPFIVGIDHSGSGGKSVWPSSAPLRTITQENRFALVSAFMSKYFGGVTGADLRAPTPTVTAVDHNAIVTSHITKFFGTTTGSDMRKPVPTVTGGGQHIGEVRAFLTKYYGTGIGQGCIEPLHTVTAKDRLGLVMVAGEPYRIADIGLRMLRPRELARAQGFPDDYVLAGSQSAQVSMIGNSVSPYVAKALVHANVVLGDASACAAG